MKVRSAADVYLSKWPKSSDSFRTLRGALEAIARTVADDPSQASVETFPWHELRYEIVRGISAELSEGGGIDGEPLSVRTVNKCLSALRGVLDSAWRMGQIPDEEYRKIKVENVRGTSDPAGHPLSSEDVRGVLAALAGATSRDAALIAVMFACGLRRVEVVRLRREDYDPATGKVRAFGKGNKSRSVPLDAGWRPMFQVWWEARPAGSLIFPGEDDGPMSRRGVSYLVEKFCARASVARFTPHDLRRTFATDFLKAGGDIAALARLLGHASIQTTVGSYDRRTDEAAEAILAKRPSPSLKEVWSKKKKLIVRRA